MAFLIQARVRVSWYGINLSSYDGDEDFPKGQPVVYDIDVNLPSETQGPTGTMKWDPTGPGMVVYESFLSNKEKMASQIKVEIFYPNGKTVPFIFSWTGQTISYGNEMVVSIRMQSELAGLVNSNQRSIAETDVSGKGLSPVDMIEAVQKKYALGGEKGIVGYTKKFQ